MPPAIRVASPTALHVRSLVEEKLEEKAGLHFPNARSRTRPGRITRNGRSAARRFDDCATRGQGGEGKESKQGVKPVGIDDADGSAVVTFVCVPCCVLASVPHLPLVPRPRYLSYCTVAVIGIAVLLSGSNAS